MQLTFQLRYHTVCGQSLWLTGSHPRLGDGDAARALPLQHVNEQLWRATVEWPETAAPQSETAYHYILRQRGGPPVHDGGDKTIAPELFRHPEALVMDSWNPPGAVENAFYTEPFRQVLLKTNHAVVSLTAPRRPTHTFNVKAPLLASGHTLCLLGGGSALGDWQTAGPLLMSRADDGDCFSAQVNLDGQPFPIAYKYGVFDAARGAFVRFEEGANRLLDDAVAPGKHTVVNDSFVALPADTWRGAGVAIPVFSLRSEASFGIGEFNDLKKLADWGARVGLKLVQILPVHDTTATHTWKDSYPYAAISAFALHPIYLNLERVAAGPNKARLKKLEPERRRLNALDAVDYAAVMKAKLAFLRQIFRSQKARTFARTDYRRFFAENRRWLEPYAAFCHLRDRFGTTDFDRWPEHKIFCAEEVGALTAKQSPARDDIEFHCFVQFHLHLQLKEAAEHLHKRGLILKGDIPIGVGRHGADTWQTPGLFHLDIQSGAPPDPFSAKGQNWNFPTYNWRRMEQDDFAWWRRRFEQMGRYFDAFRIDHVLGFFRIWSIPAHAVEGVMGRFMPAIPVTLDEFVRRGVAFDRDRFTRPWITDAVLRGIFGADDEIVKREFLIPDSDGRYSLKPEFATQRAVERHLARRTDDSPPPATEDRESAGVRAIPKLKEGLFDLISNVILFEAEGADRGQFHFRFAMEDTWSFKALAQPTQAALKELYVDYFFRRQEDFWRAEAMRKLPALKRATNMLVCGEDLGLVPACVPGVMTELGLLGLEVQRMPKGLGREFSRPAAAPYLSVVTPGTHDMSVLRAWWTEDPRRTQQFCNQELALPGDAPAECGPEIVQAIVRQHLASPAMWSIFQLQDLLGMDAGLRRADPAAERINVPAQTGFYWRYRMHLTLEALLEAEAFNRELRRMVEVSGR